MATIYLVRHAESIANTQGTYQGITYDTDLSEAGKQQAEALARLFDSVEIGQIIASPLKRTMQTAAFVARAKDMEVFAERQIIETNHGQWEGKHKDEIRRTWPRLYRKWQRFPSSTKFPDGEHFLETQKRVVIWWREFSQTEKDSLVVSHDNIIRVIVAKILNMKLNRIWKFHLQPTAITQINSTNGTSALVRLGDGKHLEDLSVNLSMHAL